MSHCNYFCGVPFWCQRAVKYLETVVKLVYTNEAIKRSSDIFFALIIKITNITKISAYNKLSSIELEFAFTYVSKPISFPVVSRSKQLYPHC